MIASPKGRRAVIRSPGRVTEPLPRLLIRSPARRSRSEARVSGCIAPIKRVWCGTTHRVRVAPTRALLSSRIKRSFMSTQPEILKNAEIIPIELKQEPRSKGITTPRKKKPKELAVITECCTGCAGSPACVEYCPVEDCMFWVPDEDHPPFGRIQVDSVLCIGCKKCTSKGPDGAFLDGCPWDAIVMLDIAEVEKVVGVMTF